MSERNKQLLATMVYEAVRFSSWAVGEGITPVAGEPAKDPGEFLSDYVTGIDGDDYEGLAEVARDAIVGAPPSGGPVAWVDIADNGNVRFWTDNSERAAWESERGRLLSRYTLAQLVALAARSASGFKAAQNSAESDLAVTPGCPGAGTFSRSAAIAAGPVAWQFLKNGGWQDTEIAPSPQELLSYPERFRRKAAPTTSPEPDAVREITATLKQWVEALRTPTIAEHTIGEIARYNDGRCITEDLELAIAALSRPAHGGWSTDFSNAPTEWGDYFLLRPRGIHSRTGKPYIPTIVQRIEGEFHTTDNELDPVYFGQNEDDDHPLKTTLEWRPLPADWLVDTTVPRNDHRTGEPRS